MRSFVSNKIATRALAALVCVLAAVTAAPAADYPNRVVTLVVPYPPGGGVDAMARVVAAKLSDAFKQQVIVDNKPGAGGTLGTRLVAHAAPDAIRCCSATPAPSRSIPAFSRTPATIRARTSRRSGWSPPCRWR